MGQRLTVKPTSDRGGKIAATVNRAKLTPLIAYSQPAIVLIAAPKKQIAIPARTKPLYAGAQARVCNQLLVGVMIFIISFLAQPCLKFIEIHGFTKEFVKTISKAKILLKYVVD
jgi:hypothetical protein